MYSTLKNVGDILSLSFGPPVVDGSSSCLPAVVYSSTVVCVCVGVAAAYADALVVAVDTVAAVGVPSAVSVSVTPVTTAQYSPAFRYRYLLRRGVCRKLGQGEVGYVATTHTMSGVYRKWDCQRRNPLDTTWKTTPKNKELPVNTSKRVVPGASKGQVNRHMIGLYGR